MSIVFFITSDHRTLLSPLSDPFQQSTQKENS